MTSHQELVRLIKVRLIDINLIFSFESQLLLSEKKFTWNFIQQFIYRGGYSSSGREYA